MRTTIDVPDALYRRARALCAERGMTFRALVIDAVERSLAEVPVAGFRLRDASAGHRTGSDPGVSAEAIEQAIDAQREHLP